MHRLVGLRHLTPILRLPTVGIEEVTIEDVSVTKVDHLLELGDAVEDEEPALAKVVTLVSRQLQDLLDHQQVLVFDSVVTCD